jgi:hypothetical protein
MFESLDQPVKVTLKLDRPLERSEQIPIVDRARLRLACLMAVDVTRHELAEQFADRRVAGRALESPPSVVVNLDTRHVVASFFFDREPGTVRWSCSCPKHVASTP